MPQPKYTRLDLWNGRARFRFYCPTWSGIGLGNARLEPNLGRLKLPQKKKKKKKNLTIYIPLISNSNPNPINSSLSHSTAPEPSLLLLYAHQPTHTFTISVHRQPPLSPPSTSPSSPFPLSLIIGKLSPTLSLSLLLATQAQLPFSQAFSLSVSLSPLKKTKMTI